MNLQALFTLVQSKSLCALMRGMYYAARYGKSSYRTFVFRQLRYTPRYVKLDRGVRLWKNSRIECVCGDSSIPPLLEIKQDVNVHYCPV